MNGVTFDNCAFLNCRFISTVFFATTFTSCKMVGSEFIRVNAAMVHIVGGNWPFTNMRLMEFKKKEFKDVNFSDFGSVLHGPIWVDLGGGNFILPLSCSET